MEDLEEATNGDDQPPASAANDLAKFDKDQSRKRLHFNDEEDGEGLLDDDEEEEEDDDEIDRQDHGYTSDPEIGTAKRSYKFKDENGSPSGRRERA